MVVEKMKILFGQIYINCTKKCSYIKNLYFNTSDVIHQYGKSQLRSDSRRKNCTEKTRKSQIFQIISDVFISTIFNKFSPIFFF